jgi:hypothetical protein
VIVQPVFRLRMLRFLVATRPGRRVDHKTKQWHPRNATPGTSEDRREK